MIPLAPDDARAPLERGVDPSLRVEGSVLVAATQGAGATPHRCAIAAGDGAEGIAGFTIPRATPGALFAVIATGANAREQDLDVTFFRSLGGCSPSGGASAVPHANAWGDEAGVVPADATSAVVWLAEGGAATFRYHEFEPPAPDLAPWTLTNAMHFRPMRVEAATSTYNDLYEPHVAVAGTGAIYVTGHTLLTDSHRSPAFVSRDDGATWRALPDPEPLPDATRDAPVFGGRVGQGNEGGIAADASGRAWLWDAAWIAGSSPLYGWCDDGDRSCAFEPVAFDHASNAESACGDDPPRVLDKPWARATDEKVLLASVGLRSGFVEEFSAASMLGLRDVETGEIEWNPCVGIGGVPGVPALRADGHVAVPQVARDENGLGMLVARHGPSLREISTTPLLPVHRSWQACSLFNAYSSFSAAGTFYAAAALDDRTLAVAATPDFAGVETLAWDAGGVVRYLWIEGSSLGEGALVTWAVADSCALFAPITFYAAHVALRGGALALENASVVVANAVGPCGHYSGNDLGPDGRAYVIVDETPGSCQGTVPQFVPTFHAPWVLYVQDAGPTI